MVAPMVNLSMAYANLKQNDKAEAWLRRALKAEPDNAAANFNLGLLLAETGRRDEAEKALRAALKSDPQLAPAAYNLAVILGEKKDLAGAVQWCRKAHDLRPDELKYTAQPGLLSERKRRQGRGRRRARRRRSGRTRGFSTAAAILAGIYESRGERKAAARVLRDALQQPGFPPQLREQWQAHAERWKSSGAVLLTLCRKEPTVVFGYSEDRRRFTPVSGVIQYSLEAPCGFARLSPTCVGAQPPQANAL